MSKKWEVELTYTVTVAVNGAENEEQAVEYAEDELSFVSGLNLLDGRCRVITDPVEWDRVKRHADEISEE